MSHLLDGLVLVGAYLLGAFPTGLLVGKLARGIDLREHGSKNIGATNAWRVLGWKLGLTTFIIDVAKAYAAVAVGAALIGAGLPHAAIWCGVAALLGNFFNVFLGGKGGKGVATSLGVFLALTPVPILICLAVFGIILKVTGYVSLGSITAAVLLPILVAVFGGIGPLFWMILAISTLVIVKHRANIVRLMNGTENKMGKKK